MNILQNCPLHQSRLSDGTWEMQKVIFSSRPILFIHTSDYFRYLRRKQTVTQLPTPRENVTTLTCEMQNFFIRQKVCRIPSNVRDPEKNRF